MMEKNEVELLLNIQKKAEENDIIFALNEIEELDFMKKDDCVGFHVVDGADSGIVKSYTLDMNNQQEITSIKFIDLDDFLWEVDLMDPTNEFVRTIKLTDVVQC